jgi:hypothetical protein
MKYNPIILSLLALLILSTVATAYDTTLDTQIVGGVKTHFWDMQTPHRWESDGDTIFFQLAYAGETTLELAWCPDSGSAIRCYYRNQSGSIGTDINITKTTGVSPTCHPSAPWNWSSLTLNISSNTGIVFCNGVTGGFHISPENSNITWGAVDYSLRSYVAGSSYPVYVIDKYFSGDTVIQGGTYVSTFFAFPNTTTSYFNLTTFTPSCSQATGIVDYNYYNYNRSDQTQTQNGLWYANITAITDLNFTLIYPSTATVIAQGGKVNFTVASSNPSAVDGIGWYINHDPIANTTNNYSISYTFNTPGLYTIEAQLEDITCTRFRTANFTVQVGKIIGLSGTVTSASTGQPLSYQVGITNADFTFQEIQNVDAIDDGGVYHFTNLVEDNYTILVVAAGYTSEFKSRELLYGTFFETNYTQDFTLDTTAVTNGVTVNAFDYATGALLTNYNLTLYQGLIPLLKISNGAAIYNATINNYVATNTGNPTTIEGIPVGTEYTVSIRKAGYYTVSYETASGTLYNSSLTWVNSEAQQTLNLYLSPPNGTATTTTTTTITSTTSTTISYVSLVCSANTTADDINCCLDSSIIHPNIAYSTSNQSGGLTLFNSSDCFSVVNDLGADGYCNTWYIIDVLGYPEAQEFTQTRLCNGSLPTTTTITTTTVTTPSTIPGCDLSDYDVIPDCFIEDVGNAYGLVDYNSGKITLACYTQIEYYYNTHTKLPGCYVTTTSRPISSTTIPTVPLFDCSNVTGKVRTDPFNASVCAYALPLGAPLFFGLILVMLVATVYTTLRSWIASGVIALIFTSLFITYLPVATGTILSIGIAIGFGCLLMELLMGREKQQEEAQERRRFM